MVFNRNRGVSVVVERVLRGDHAKLTVTEGRSSDTTEPKGRLGNVHRDCNQNAPTFPPATLNNGRFPLSFQTREFSYFPRMM